MEVDGNVLKEMIAKSTLAFGLLPIRNDEAVEETSAEPDFAMGAMECSIARHSKGCSLCT